MLALGVERRGREARGDGGYRNRRQRASAALRGDFFTTTEFTPEGGFGPLPDLPRERVAPAGYPARRGTPRPRGERRRGMQKPTAEGFCGPTAQRRFLDNH